MIPVKEKKAESKILQNSIKAKEEEIALRQQLMRCFREEEYMKEVTSSSPVVKEEYAKMRAKLGWYQMQLYNFKEAIEDLTWCIRHKSSAALYSDRALAYAALGNADDSYRDWEKVEQCIVPADRKYFARHYENFADAAHKKGDYQIATIFYQAALDLYFTRKTNDKLSGVYAATKNIKLKTDKKIASIPLKGDANKELEKLLNRNIANLQTGLAILKYEIGDIKGAIVSCTEAISLTSEFPALFEFRAWFQLRMSNYTEAIADWTHAINQQSNDDLLLLKSNQSLFAAYNGRSLVNAVLGKTHESSKDRANAQKYTTCLDPRWKLFFARQYLQHADSEKEKGRLGIAIIFYQEVLRLCPELTYKIPLRKDEKTSIRAKNIMELMVGFESLSDLNNHFRIDKSHQKSLFPLFQEKMNAQLQNEWEKLTKGVLKEYVTEASWEHLSVLFENDHKNRKGIHKSLIDESSFGLINNLLIKSSYLFNMDPVFLALKDNAREKKESAAKTLRKLIALGVNIQDKTAAVATLKCIFSLEPKEYEYTDRFLVAIGELFFKVFAMALLSETYESHDLSTLIKVHAIVLNGIVRASDQMLVEEILIMKLRLHLLIVALENRPGLDGDIFLELNKMRDHKIVDENLHNALKRGERENVRLEINDGLAQLWKFSKTHYGKMCKELKQEKKSEVIDQELLDLMRKVKFLVRTSEIDLLLSVLQIHSKRVSVTEPPEEKEKERLINNILIQLEGEKCITDACETTLLNWEYTKSKMMASATPHPGLSKHLRKLESHGKIKFKPINDALWSLRFQAFVAGKKNSFTPDATLPGDSPYLRFFFPSVQPKAARLDNSAYLIKQRELEIIFSAIHHALERHPEKWGLDDQNILLSLKSMVSMDEARNWFGEHWNWEKHQQLKAVFSEKMEKLESKTEVELAEKSEFLKKILEFLNAMDGFVASTTQKSDVNIRLCTREAKNLPKVTPIPDEIDILPADAVSKPIEALRQLNQPGAFLARHARSPQTLRLFLFDPTQHDKPFRYNITLMANGHWHLWTPKDERSAYHIHYESRGEMETPAAKSRLASFVRAQLPILSRACGFNRSAPLFRHTETAESNTDLQQNPSYPLQTTGRAATGL